MEGWIVAVCIVVLIVGLIIGLSFGIERQDNRTMYWCDNAHRVELNAEWYECRKERIQEQKP